MLSLDDLIIPTIASLVPDPSFRCRRWPSTPPLKGRLTVAKAKPPRPATDRTGLRWDREAVKVTTDAIKLLQRTDPERTRKVAEAAEWREERDRLRKTASGRAALGIHARTFVGPPTPRQHAAALARAERKATERVQAAERVQAVPVAPAPPVTPKPSEADLAARKAAALAKSAALAALLRAPPPP